VVVAGCVHGMTVRDSNCVSMQVPIPVRTQHPLSFAAAAAEEAAGPLAVRPIWLSSELVPEPAGASAAGPRNDSRRRVMRPRVPPVVAAVSAGGAIWP
jgi:hypothetical protein